LEPLDRKYIGYFVDHVKPRKIKFGGQLKPNNRCKNVEYVNNLSSILGGSVFYSLSDGWYVVRANARYVSGPLRGQVRWGKPLCWVFMKQTSNAPRLWFFKYENIQVFPIISQ